MLEHSDKIFEHSLTKSVFTCNVISNRSLLKRKFANLNEFTNFSDFTAGKNDKKICENDEESRNSGHLVGRKV